MSKTSRIALSYENDVSNLIRVGRLSSQPICTLTYDKNEEKKTFLDCVKSIFENSTNMFDAMKDESINMFISMKYTTHECIKFLREHVVLTANGGEILEEERHRKFKFRKLMTPNSIQLTNNIAFNVIISKWYPESSNVINNRISNKIYESSDFLSIQKAFPFISNTVSDTLSNLDIKDTPDNRSMLISYLNKILSSSGRTNKILITSTMSDSVNGSFYLDHVKYLSYPGRNLNIISTKVIDSQSSIDYGLSNRDTSDPVLFGYLKDMISGLIYLNFRRKGEISMVSDPVKKTEVNERYLSCYDNYLRCYNSVTPSTMKHRRFIDFLSDVDPMVVYKSVLSPALFKSYVVVQYLFSKSYNNNALEIYNNQSRNTYYFYGKEQNKLASGKFDSKAPIEICIHHENSRMIYSRTEKTEKIYLDLKNSHDLDSLFKLLTDYSLESGYSPMPATIIKKFINKKYFSKMDAEAMKHISGRESDKYIKYIDRGSGRSTLTRVSKHQIELGDLIFNVPIVQGTVRMIGKYPIRLDVIHPNHYNFVFDVGVEIESYRSSHRKYESIMRVNQNLFCFSKIMNRKSDLDDCERMTELDFIIEMGMLRETSDFLKGSPEVFSDSSHDLYYIKYDINHREFISSTTKKISFEHSEISSDTDSALERRIFEETASTGSNVLSDGFFDNMDFGDDSEGEDADEETHLNRLRDDFQMNSEIYNFDNVLFSRSYPMPKSNLLEQYIYNSNRSFLQAVRYFVFPPSIQSTMENLLIDISGDIRKKDMMNTIFINILKVKLDRELSLIPTDYEFRDVQIYNMDINDPNLPSSIRMKLLRNKRKILMLSLYDLFSNVNTVAVKNKSYNDSINIFLLFRNNFILILLGKFGSFMSILYIWTSLNS
jgi:hypothetical protein